MLMTGELIVKGSNQPGETRVRDYRVWTNRRGKKYGQEKEK